MRNCYATIGQVGTPSMKRSSSASWPFPAYGVSAPSIRGRFRGNPVDHPNGGGAGNPFRRRLQSLLALGLLAKGYRTRHKKETFKPFSSWFAGWPSNEDK